MEQTPDIRTFLGKPRPAKIDDRVVGHFPTEYAPGSHQTKIYHDYLEGRITKLEGNYVEIHAEGAMTYLTWLKHDEVILLEEGRTLKELMEYLRRKRTSKT